MEYIELEHMLLLDQVFVSQPHKIRQCNYGPKQAYICRHGMIFVWFWVFEWRVLLRSIECGLYPLADMSAISVITTKTTSTTINRQKSQKTHTHKKLSNGQNELLTHTHTPHTHSRFLIAVLRINIWPNYLGRIMPRRLLVVFDRHNYYCYLLCDFGLFCSAIVWF